MDSIEFKPVGTVVSSRKAANDFGWDAETSSIHLDPAQCSAESLKGLTDFSHAMVVFHMNQLDAAKVQYHSRHPRDNPDWPKIGIFAQRAGGRPNRIGVTVCKIKAVDGLTLQVEGLDAIDGTPVLDIKPWVAEFGPRGETSQPDWMAEVMQEYWEKAG